MNKYKATFKKNLTLMLTLVLVIVMGIFVINQLRKNNNVNNVKIGGSFKLTDNNGEIYDSKLIEKKKLIYFGYTFCPDICPFDILKLSKFIDNNPDVKERMEFLFITIDPERDGIKEIRGFLENFNPSIKGLTGSAKEISSIIKDFRIYVRKNLDSSNNQNYLVDHSSLFFLLDKNDSYITHFRPDTFNSKINNYI